ncbi:MAG TPA: chorismate-binding protein, partial [bacterium]|nr:chorismate-binding protein [bacterium]
MFELTILPERAAALASLAAGRAVTLQASVVNDVLTPIAAFQKLAANQPNAYLLESVEGGEQVGRLSMLGLGAVRRFSYRDGIFRVQQNGDPAGEIPTAKPLDELRRAFHAVPVEPAHIGVRFANDAVGYIGYKTVHTFEDIELKNATALGSFPEMDLRVAETVLVFDRVLNRLHLLTYVFPGGDAGAAYDAATARLRATAAELAAATAEPLPLLPVAGNARTPIRGVSNQTREQYESAVRRALDYIRAGDIFQVVPSQRWAYPLAQDPLHIYRCLRAVNPSPYMFFIKLDGARYLIGSSPEILVRLEGGTATVRPIAGTRPRGKTEAEDAKLAEELQQDPKERAEHVMLV